MLAPAGGPGGGWAFEGRPRQHRALRALPAVAPVPGDWRGAHAARIRGGGGPRPAATPPAHKRCCRPCSPACLQ